MCDMITNGVTINFVDDQGRTALHYACYYGDELMVKVLLQHFIKNGIDVNATDNNGRTPLHHAVRSGHLKVTRKVIYK